MLSKIDVQPTKVMRPIQFFSMISYLAAVVLVGTGVAVFRTDTDKAVGWFLIGVGSLLITGVSVGLFYIWWKYPERFIEPKDLTKDFVESLRALRPGGEIDPETAKKMEALALESFLFAHSRALSFGTELLRELSNVIDAADSKRKRNKYNLHGKWTGEVNNQNQLITIVHDASELLLEGHVTNADGKDIYSFGGRGWICAGNLVFCWQIRAAEGMGATGINIMRIIDDGNTIEGKFFNTGGAKGYECYKRKEEAQAPVQT